MSFLTMGVKEVLYRTSKLSRSADTDLYQSVEDFSRRFPARLATRGARVIKQNRGNGGQGVWKVELIGDVGPNPSTIITIHNGKFEYLVEVADCPKNRPS